MCAGAIVQARLRRVIFGANDPKAGACGSALEVLNHAALNHRVDVVPGVLAGGCARLLREFFRLRRDKAFSHQRSAHSQNQKSDGLD
jgi:tRNA(adenine34) deaminase